MRRLALTSEKDTLEGIRLSLFLIRRSLRHRYGCYPLGAAVVRMSAISTASISVHKDYLNRCLNLCDSPLRRL